MRRGCHKSPSMSYSSSPDRSFSTALQLPEQYSPASVALRQLDSLLQSLIASRPTPSSLFDADNLCLYCESRLTYTSPSSAALLLLPSTVELPCGHRLCRPCYSGVLSRRRTCPIPLCDCALPLESIVSASSPSPQRPLPAPMIKSKSEPSLFNPPACSLQAQVLSGSSVVVGHAFHRVPSLGQLSDAEGRADAPELTTDSFALTLPLHLLDVAAVKTVVDAADVFDVAHDFTPARAQATAESHSSDAITDAAARLEHMMHAPPVVTSSDCDPAATGLTPRSFPPYIKPSVSLLPARVRAAKGDVPPIPPPCLRLPWHLELPPVVHTFTLKTEHPGKPGMARRYRVL